MSENITIGGYNVTYIEGNDKLPSCLSIHERVSYDDNIEFCGDDLDALKKFLYRNMK